METTYIGESTDELMTGKKYNATVAKFTGRKYKPGKEVNGWLDKEGEPDNRFMIYGGVPYKVYESADALLKDWRPENLNDPTFKLLLKFSGKNSAQTEKV